MPISVNIRDYGARGDSLSDDRAAIQAALDSGAEEVVIPQGIYCVSDTLKVHSNTKINAWPGAKIVMRSAARRRRNDFLLTNADTVNGNINIRISGGIWDGNNMSPHNAKPDDLFDANGYSGAVLNFVNVKGLTLEHMVVANSTTYFVRMGKLEDFDISDISFVSDRPGKNQDGLHFSGGVRRGHVRDIRALSYGQTNDDMIALNADDSIARVENFDLSRDAIEDITFENIFAENCHCIIRMLSVSAPIRRIIFKNIYGGYRNYAINCDAARYCRTPLFNDDEHPDGVGVIEDIEIDGFSCHPVADPLPGFEGFTGNCSVGLMMETRLRNFRISGFDFSAGSGREGCVAMRLRCVPGQRIIADGAEFVTREKSDTVSVPDFKELFIDRI